MITIWFYNISYIKTCSGCFSTKYLGEDPLLLLYATTPLWNTYNNNNKIFFALKKLEMIHLTRKSGDKTSACKVSNELTIYSIITANNPGQPPAPRWLEHSSTANWSLNIM